MEGQALEGSGRFGWLFVRRLDHFIENPLKLIQTRGRDDDIIAAAVHVFRDAQKPPARIFFK